jgi:dihydroxyacid dehydratase/phosphogluconate dehydratase
MHQAAAGGNVAVVAKLLEKEAVKNEENTVCEREVEERE